MIEDLEHSVARRAGGGQHLVELIKLTHGLVNEGAVSKKTYEVAEGEIAPVLLALDEETAADAHDRDGPKGAEEVGAGAVQGPAVHGLEGVVAQEVGGVPEATALAVAEGKRADEAMAGYVFHEQAVERTGGFPGIFPQDASRFEVHASEDEHDGQRSQHQGGKERLLREEDGTDADEGQEADGALFGSVEQGALHVLHILDDARSDFTGLALVVVADRKFE